MESKILNSYLQYYLSNHFQKEKERIAVIDESASTYFLSFLSNNQDANNHSINLSWIERFRQLLLDKISFYTSDVKVAISIVKELDELLANKTTESKVSYLVRQLPQLCWIVNDSGEIIDFNSNWSEYTGIKALKKSKEWFASIHEEDRLAFENTLQLNFLQRGVFGLEYRLKDAEANYRWFSLKCIPLIDQYQQIYWIGINSDVNELIDAAEKIESINNDLDNFIYIASHDLKAPISNLEGLLHIIEDLLGKKLEEDEILRSVLQMINESIVKLQATIKDLAHVSKIQRNLSEDIEEVKFAELIGDVASEIREEIKDAEATISMEFTDAPVVRFSKQDMKSVLSNLISNAIKYKSPERKPEVLISSSKKNGQVVLMVKDNGLGIPDDKKNYIFNMFKRLHDHVEGSGIGLYIVKRIIDNNQGAIEVESEVGKGSVFKVYFPEE